MSYTSFLGIFPQDFLNKIGGFGLSDGFLLLSSAYLVIFFVRNFNISYNLIGSRISKYVLFFMALHFVYIITMPLRAEVSLIESFKAGRQIFVFNLYFLIILDLELRKDFQWYLNLIRIIAVVYALASILNGILPEIGQRIFQGIRMEVYENAWGLEIERFVIKRNNGILFLYLAFIIELQRFFNRKNVRKLPYVLIFLVGIIFQGWRAPFLGVIIIFIFLYFKEIFINPKEFLKPAIYLLLFIAAIWYIDTKVASHVFTSKIVSSYDEIIEGKEGSYQGRKNRVSTIMMPQIKERLLWGWGFVHNTSEEGDKNLYFFDNGFLNVVITFGLIGSTLYFGAFLYILIFVIRAKPFKMTLLASQVTILFIAFLFLISMTFGSFTIIGLLPFSIILPLSDFEIRRIALIK